ncbi:hypothetical protein [Amycolatopsis kentuckyensis]|nr:hypothetical protein [Amycolatopsis kentuckyensis]
MVLVVLGGGAGVSLVHADSKIAAATTATTGPFRVFPRSPW